MATAGIVNRTTGGSVAGRRVQAKRAAAPPSRERRVASTSYEDLLRLLHHLLASESSVRRSDAAALALELAWLRAAELPKLVRIEELLAGGAALTAPGPMASSATPTPPPATPAPVTSPPAPRLAPPPAGTEARPRLVPTPPAEPAAPAPAPAPTPTPAGAEAPSVARFFEELALRRPTLAAQLGVAECSFDAGLLEIAYAPGDNLVASSLLRPANRSVLDAAVAAVFGAGARWRPRERAGIAGAPPAVAKPAAAQPAAAAREHPRVQAVLEIFGGSIATVADATEEPGEPE